jgi:bifunctional DNA-binding transcriptional regulator/antitoxin component of YhaV-PrlF toxin-antitoxin module
MTKKETKPKKSVTLEIDEAVADALGINQKADLEMIVVDDVLIVKAKDKQSAKARNAKFEERTSSLMDKYESVLKKLAKT